MLIGPPNSALVRDENDVLHVGAVSGGKDSSAMGIELRQRHPERPFVWICTPTGDEPAAMVAHWLRLGEKFGSRIWPVTTGKSLAGLVRHYGALPNWRQRWCTRELKIEPYGQWMDLQTVFGPVVSYVGLRADEPEREGGDYDAISGVTATFPMREWGWGLSDVQECLSRNEIVIPDRTDCNRCYHQTLFEWFKLWRDEPEIYADAAREEAETGHTFRSPSRDTWPADLASLANLFEFGEIPTPRQRQTACRVCSL